MLTPGQINFLNQIRLKWTCNNDIINVDGTVDIQYSLTRFPVQFGEIYGNFHCQHSGLTTLQGSPIIVSGDFDCDHNQLTSLEGGPFFVGGYYSCAHNKLTNLIHSPKICNTFICEHNKLTSLEGCPDLIKSLHCINNPNLRTLYGIKRVGNVQYDAHSEINEWICSCAQKNVFGTHIDIINNIKNNYRIETLLNAPEVIRKIFKPYILQLADTRIII